MTATMPSTPPGVRTKPEALIEEARRRQRRRRRRTDYRPSPNPDNAAEWSLR